MTVRYYRYDDVGAPALSTPNAGLIAVLDACLVNGYGSKPGAGWAKEFSGTNLAAYRQGAGSMCYLRVNNATGTGQARVVGYESMSDIDTGANAFPKEAQSAGGLYVNINASTAVANKPWVLIADERRFYLWVGYATAMTSLTPLSTSATYQGLFFFGDVVSYKPGDAFCCQIIGATSSAANTERFGLTASLGVAVPGHYIVRDHTHAVGALANGKFHDYVASGAQLVMGGSASRAYPDPVSGGFGLSRVSVTNGVASPATRGRLPGCWGVLNALPGANGDTFSGAGDLASRTFILLDCGSSTTRGRVALETSDTWD